MTIERAVRFALWALAAAFLLLPILYYRHQIGAEFDLATVMSLLPFLGITLAGALFVVGITQAPPKSREPKQPVRQVLQDPFVQRTIKRLELGGVFAGLVALLFAIWGLYQANEQSRLAKQALNDQRISSAWQIISQPASGSSGKGYALGILANETEDELYGLEFGCKRKPDDASIIGCTLNTKLRKLSIGSRDRAETILSDSDFSHVEISDSRFENVYISKVDVRDASIWNTTFKSAMMSDLAFEDASVWATSFESTALFNVSFERANVEAEFENVSLTYVSFARPDVWVTGPLVFRHAAFFQMDFSGFDFTPVRAAVFTDGEPTKLVEKVRIEGRSNVFGEIDEMDDIPMIGGAYSPERRFNISGAVFCREDRVLDQSVVCWAHAQQAFFDHAYFYAGEPPQGLHLLPFEPKLRGPCQPLVKGDDVEQQELKRTYAEPPHDGPCINGPLLSLSELKLDG
ncbi:MAG: pentapeptide repeat-containing protein [Rhizobiaceae bacterium]|nr:pentapeptide repeat-containing protein [Rhizobiaceae bacterium]